LDPRTLLELRTDAPVVLRLEVEVAATPDRIWAHLVDVEHWYRFHPGMDFASLRGEDPAPGIQLRWRADGMRVSSILHEVDPGRRLSWTLRTPGGRGYQRWTLEEASPERTLVRTEESWWGLLPFILRGTLRRTLRVSRTAWLEGLREIAEDPDRQPPEDRDRRPPEDRDRPGP
jgi:hypothetical protein